MDRSSPRVGSVRGADAGVGTEANAVMMLVLEEYGMGWQDGASAGEAVR